MKIKNLKTGNLIRFGGEHFKRLLNLQETTGVKYFTKKDLTGCVSANKKTITKTQQKVNTLGTNAKRKQKGGVLINANTVRQYPTNACPVCFEEWTDETKNPKPFQIDECKHEICTRCAIRWFVSNENISCPQCRVQVNVEVVEEQLAEIIIDEEEVFEAIRNNNLDKIKTYVAQGGNIDEIYDESDDEEEGMSDSEEWMSGSEEGKEGMSSSGANPLTYACLKNKPEIVKYLVDIGAKLNIKQYHYNGNTPLHYAVWNNSFEIVKYLVDNGADVNVTEGEGETPLDFASKINSLKIVKYLVEKNAKVTDRALFHAVKSLQLITYLVDNGGNVNAKYRAHNSLLHNSLLHIACARGTLEIIKYLVDKGAEVNSKNDHGDTPLSYACSHGTLEIVKYLVDKGADLNAKDGDGATLLHKVCSSNKDPLEIVKYLVEEKKDDVNSQDKRGDTPLHYALNNYAISNSFDNIMQRKPLQLVKYLVEKGADVNAKNKYNKTPLDLARQKRQKEFVDFFTSFSTSKITNIKGGRGRFRKNR